jgi:hypothetical protein
VLERSTQDPVDCGVAGEVARAFIAGYREGDIVAVSGMFEPRPSTASSKTTWAGRFRVRYLRGMNPPTRVQSLGVMANLSNFDVTEIDP